MRSFGRFCAKTRKIKRRFSRHISCETSTFFNLGIQLRIEIIVELTADLAWSFGQFRAETHVVKRWRSRDITRESYNLGCSELVIFGHTIIDTSQLLLPPIPSIGTSKHGNFLLTCKFSIVDLRQSAAVLRQRCQVSHLDVCVGRGRTVS